MTDIQRGFSSSLSFAAVKDGRVAAYSLIRRPDVRHCVFEILCVGTPFQRSGIFLLPLIRALEAIRFSAVEHVAFAIYDWNEPMLTILNNHFPHLIASRTIQNNLMYTVERGPSR